MAGVTPPLLRRAWSATTGAKASSSASSAALTHSGSIRPSRRRRKAFIGLLCLREFGRETMRSSFALVFAFFAAAASAETKVEDLMKPPADAIHYSIVSSAGKHGDSARWFTADGQEMSRESMVLRGQVFETDGAAKFGADGMLSSVVVRGFTPNGDAGETFAIEGGKAHWKSPVDEGSAAYAAPAMYAAFGGTFDLNAILLERVLARPDHQFATLPGGKLTAEKLTEASVGKGDKKKTVTAYALTGFSNTPLPIWVDDKGKFFAFTGNLSWIAAGYEDAAP